MPGGTARPETDARASEAAASVAGASGASRPAAPADARAAFADGRLHVERPCGLALDRDEALGYVGYTGQEVDAGLRARFDALADACERQTRPGIAWAAFPVDRAATRWDADAASPQVVLAGCGLVLPGADIARHLRGARAAALIACTLGMGNERELRKHAAVSPTDGLLFGAASSALVEAAANAAEAAVVQAAAACGLHTAWRYSPGYGDLPLSVQKPFLAALDAMRRLGLSATETDLLVPTKSVTAIVGVFDEARTGGEVRSSCSGCALRSCCPLRAQGRTCHG